ncbi:MAG TPA: AAA family ATPase, partial [Gemmatimonadales bacterium]
MNPASTGRRLTVLGDLRLTGSEGDLLARRRKELALLAWVAMRSAPVRREELAAAFWGDSDDAHARQSLRQAIASIRKVVPDVLQADAETIAIAPGALSVDVVDFDRAAAAGDRRAAVDLWKGELLRAAEDLGAEPFRIWLESERARLRARVAGLLQRLAGDAATPDEQLRWSERWSELFPLDERAHLHLLGALERSGRIAEAVERHAAFASRFQAERGEEPSAAVREAAELMRQRSGLAGHQAGSAAFFTPDLTGRDAEFAALRSAWSDATRGAGVAVLIEGEPGAGRTRLGLELVRWVAGAAPAVVLEAPRDCAGNATPPEARFLAPLARARGIAAADPSALAELATVIPELSAGRTLPPRAPGTDLSASVAEVIASVAEEGPVLVFVDDAPDLCPELRAIVTRLVRRPPGRVLVVLTAETARIAATEVGRALRESPDARRLKLQPLDAAQVEVMIASMVPMPAADRERLAAILMGETDGNPLRISDCISAFADGGVLAADQNGIWRVSRGRGPGSLPLPPSVLRIRLERLSQEARRAVEAVARRGGADAEEIAALARLDDGEVEEAIGELVSRRLLRPIRDSARYEIASETIRAAVLAEATPLAAPARRRWRPGRIAVAAVATLCLAAAGLAARRAMPATAAPATDRVIVFPFENAAGIEDRAVTGRLAAEAIVLALGRTGAANVLPLVPDGTPATNDRVRSIAEASGAAYAVL